MECETRNLTNEYRYLLESNFVGVDRLSTLIYLNRNNDVKRFNAWKYYLPKGIIKNNKIINGNNFYDQAIDSVIKRLNKSEN